jgi:hypothetical protein
MLAGRGPTPCGGPARLQHRQIIHSSSLLLKQRQHRIRRGARWADEVRVNPPLLPHSTSAPQAAAALAPTDA